MKLSNPFGSKTIEFGINFSCVVYILLYSRIITGFIIFKINLIICSLFVYVLISEIFHKLKLVMYLKCSKFTVLYQVFRSQDYDSVKYCMSKVIFYFNIILLCLSLCLHFSDCVYSYTVI